MARQRGLGPATRWSRPAVYYGDREADLDMTELFGGFPPSMLPITKYPIENGNATPNTFTTGTTLLNNMNISVRLPRAGKADASLHALASWIASAARPDGTSHA